MREWRLAALEEAARIADAYADENMRMAQDTLFLDPILSRPRLGRRGTPVTEADVRRSEELMTEGCIYTSMFHAAQNIAAAIRALALKEGAPPDGR